MYIVLHSETPPPFRVGKFQFHIRICCLILCSYIVVRLDEPGYVLVEAQAVKHRVVHQLGRAPGERNRWQDEPLKKS